MDIRIDPVDQTPVPKEGAKTVGWSPNDGLGHMGIGSQGRGCARVCPEMKMVCGGQRGNPPDKRRNIAADAAWAGANVTTVNRDIDHNLLVLAEIPE